MPRVLCRCPVEVRASRGERFFGQVSDISRGGIGLLVDAVAAIRLAPGGRILGPAAPVVAVVLHRSGMGDSRPGIQLEGRIRHVRRLSQQQYLIGVHFVDPDSVRHLVQQAIAAGQDWPAPLATVWGERLS